MFLYKHKKFSAHRKRAGSSEEPGPGEKDSKMAKMDSGDDKSDKSSFSENFSDKMMSGKKSVGSPKALSGLGVKTSCASSGALTKSSNTKTEARHQMPFVWDRVTRSQAGKSTSRSERSEYSS
jgi:hypothetical protein